MNLKEITLKGEGYNLIKIPMSLFGNVKVIKKAKKDGRRIISGYANLAVVDSDRQLIPTEVLQAGIETLISDPAYANLMLFHKNIQIGKILSEYGKLKTHVDDKGLYIICEIRKDTKTANEAWELILSGEINGFSIGCEVIDKHNRCDVDGKNCIEVLDEINIFEVSITSAPVNEMSGFVVISKSKYDEGVDLQHYENVCDECGINRDNMSKKKTNSKVSEETKDETKSEEEDTITTENTEEKETEQKSVDDRIGDIERSIMNINATIEKLSEIMNPKKDDVEETKSEEESKEEEEPKETKSEEKTEKTVTPTEPEEKSDSHTDDKLDAIIKAISDLTESIKADKVEKEKKSEVDEIKLDLKARDDEIEALSKKIEILTKSKEEKKESKTVQDDSNDSTELVIEPDDPFVAERGEVYLRY